MELRFPAWERIINGNKLLQVREDILMKLNLLEKELEQGPSNDRKNELIRVRRAFKVLFNFLEELINLKDGQDAKQ
ncbi:MAG TPA: hypothetical protein VII00_04505 [bacterium]